MYEFNNTQNLVILNFNTSKTNITLHLVMSVVTYLSVFQRVICFYISWIFLYFTELNKNIVTDEWKLIFFPLEICKPARLEILEMPSDGKMTVTFQLNDI